MKKKYEPRRIILTDEVHGLPYSKGLMASSIMATGLPPATAYHIAQLVEEHLIEQGITSLNIEELRAVAFLILEREAGNEYADRFSRWQSLGKLDRPLIVLIGGTTGVGKSTIATEIAHRLGINRLVSSDMVREVMRVLFSKELMPALYSSSYDAWQAFRTPMPKTADSVTSAFLEQATAVSVGLQAIVERAVRESAHTIIEGVHLVPGLVPLNHPHACIVPLIIDVDDAELHRSHFYIRELETDGFRAFERYRANFPNIRKIGNFLKSMAEQHSVPVIKSYQLDATISQVMEKVVDKVMAEPTKRKRIVKEDIRFPLKGSDESGQSSSVVSK